MPANIVSGSLFDATEKYLCHQCNCITVKAAHLSGDVFNRYPYANVYAPRLSTRSRDIPGTIAVRGNEKNGQRLVVNLFGQYYPGKSRWNNDTYKKRALWFAKCLAQMEQLENLDQGVAFPWGIGCGAAGGDWKQYRAMIDAFADRTGAPVAIYKLSPPNE